jgi:hypothetical protein
MEKNSVKATITLDGKPHEIMISKVRAEQTKRLQRLIRENDLKKKSK